MALTNKQYKSYNVLSRYANAPIYYNTIDEKWEMGTTQYLSQETQYSYHIVKELETYDNLALYYYNNPTLYWVICDFNRIQDPFTNPEVGTKLMIPVLTEIGYE